MQPRRRPTPCVSASLSEGEAEYYSQRPPTPLLDTVNYPVHLKNLSVKELRQLADELRSDVIFHVSKAGGYLGSSLGVVDLTVALHYVFNAPQDRILWDVAHQSYPHKILTGRRDKMPTKMCARSEYDWFGTGHSSNTISMALGMAVGRDLKGGKNNVVAVIGDGAMTAGQAYEAMKNAAGCLDTDMIVILNDNKQVSQPTATLDGPVPPVGNLQYGRQLRELREVAKVSPHNPTLFEELGVCYIGPVDGHNIDDLITTLSDVKNTKITGPVLIHVITEKGRGYPCAERDADKYPRVYNACTHAGVAKFDPATGKQFKSPPKTQSYTNYFAEALIAEAEQDSKIVAIHAATGGGTGLNYFLRRFPNRCFDVGNAEQHDVRFVARLAVEGLKPFCVIYSSFLERGYEQVVHDVNLLKLPVRFAMDRAGLVGADGPTHCGAFDVAYMASLPNMVVMAPSDEAE